MALVEREPAPFPLKQQAELLGLGRASLYYQPIPLSPEEIAIKHRIDEIYTAHPFYGSRRIAAALRPQFIVNRKAVQRHMHEMGLVGIYPGPNLSQRNAEHRIDPYLLRHFTIDHPNQVWGIDTLAPHCVLCSAGVTYIRLVAGWLYLVAGLDWYSRYVLSWELDQTLELPFVLSALEQALTHAKPEIWNSDQGSHFTKPQYTQRLTAANVQISMDGQGRTLDNILTERLWRSVKYAEVYLHDDANPREAHHGLSGYCHFYHHERLHQALDYQTPAAIYFGWN